MIRPILFPVTITLALSACTGFGLPNNDMPTRDDGAAFFARNCVACHGANGAGDGPTAQRQVLRLPDLTTISARNGGDFPQARVMSYIWGDPDNDHLERVMPSFGGRMTDDLVPVEIDGILTPTPRQLAGLYFYLESIQN
ncbi:MAG: cytochrome c [Pseudomonadota bacterium]